MPLDTSIIRQATFQPKAFAQPSRTNELVQAAQAVSALQGLQQNALAMRQAQEEQARSVNLRNVFDDLSKRGETPEVLMQYADAMIKFGSPQLVQAGVTMKQKIMDHIQDLAERRRIEAQFQEQPVGAAPTGAPAPAAAALAVPPAPVVPAAASAVSPTPVAAAAPQNMSGLVALRSIFGTQGAAPAPNAMAAQAPVANALAQGPGQSDMMAGGAQGTARVSPLDVSARPKTERSVPFVSPQVPAPVAAVPAGVQVAGPTVPSALPGGDEAKALRQQISILEARRTAFATSNIKDKNWLNATIKDYDERIKELRADLRDVVKSQSGGEFQQLLNERARLEASGQVNSPQHKAVTDRIAFLSGQGAMTQAQVEANKIAQARLELETARVNNDRAGVLQAERRLQLLEQEAAQRADPAFQARMAAAQAAGTAAGRTQIERQSQSAEITNVVSELERVLKPGGLIDQSTGSGAGALTDVAAGFFGIGTPGAVAIGKLQPIADAALKIVPRFEGPQSNADTISYKEAAGKLADPTVPNNIRRAAGEEIVRILRDRKGRLGSTVISFDFLSAPQAAPAPPPAPAAAPTPASVSTPPPAAAPPAAVPANRPPANRPPAPAPAPAGQRTAPRPTVSNW